MSAIDDTAVILKPGLIPGGHTVTREIPGVGILKFEDYGPGQWMTQAGTPGKRGRRRYLLNDEELDSVSKIVGVLEKPALTRWIETQAAIGAVQAERMGELVGVPEEDYAERSKLLGLGASAKRDEGADRGKVIHAAAHLLAVEKRIPNPADFDGAARPWVQAMMRAWIALNPGEVLLAEEPICNPELGYAGTPDLVAMIDGRVTLVDYKTGKGRIYEAAHWQTRLYEMGLLCCGIGVEDIILVGIADDGTFELIRCEITREDAAALVAVRRANLRANRGMSAQRKAMRG